MKRLILASIIVLTLLHSALLNASAQAGASEYRLNLTSAPHGTPICYTFNTGGDSIRALTRIDNGQWYLQVDSRYSYVVMCNGYAWSRIDASSTITLTPSTLSSHMVYEDIERLPHDVDATVCRMAPLSGISYCYAPIVSIDSDSDGARWWVNVNDGWSITQWCIDGITYYEYNLLTRLTDGRVVVDPSDPSEFTPWCVSFNDDGSSSRRALVRFDYGTMTWRIDVEASHHFALYCDDRQITIIEDADKGMPGAIMILDGMPMSTVQLYRITDSQDVTVSASLCTDAGSSWTRYNGQFCFNAEVWTESAEDHSFTEWYTNVTNGWTLTTSTSQDGATSAEVR